MAQSFRSGFSFFQVAPLEESLLPEGGATLAMQPLVHSMAGPHSHPELEVNLTLKGRAVYDTPEGRHPLEPFTLVFLAPGSPHVLLEATGDFSYWLGLFSPDFLQSASPLLGGLPFLGEIPSCLCRPLSRGRAESLASLFLAASQSAGSLSRAAGLLHALAATWDLAQSGEDGPPSGSCPVARACQALQRDPCLTLPEAAREAGVSPGYLSAAFPQKAGMRFSAYRNQVRMDRFKKVMACGCESVQEAAFEAGFGSLAQFHRVVRAATGMSPREWYNHSHVRS